MGADLRYVLKYYLGSLVPAPPGVDQLHHLNASLLALY